MFRALYRRLRRRKQSDEHEQGDDVPTTINVQAQSEPKEAQPDLKEAQVEHKEAQTEPKVAKPEPKEAQIEIIEAQIQTIEAQVEIHECAVVEEIKADEAGATSSSTTTIVASKSQQTVTTNPDQLKVLATRQQMVMMLSRLCEAEAEAEAEPDAEAEGDGDTNQIVLELLGSYDGAIMPSPSPIERMSKQLLGVLREQTLHDAGIAPGNERYRCFESVLQNYTKIYAARRFMEQLPKLGQSEVVPQVAANEVLQIPMLLRQLWSSLDKMEFFNEDSAFKAYLEARHHPEARILSELLLTRISRVFLAIVSSTMFLEFSERELLHILRNCYLSVNSEIEIFLAMVLWMEHNWTEPDNCAERLLAEVRFGLMPSWYLTTMARANRCQHFSRVIGSPAVQRMIAQGLEETITVKKKPRFPSNTNIEAERAGAKEQSLLDETPLPRDWIVDIECRHHHKCHCRFFIYPTYEVFKSNLARLICRSPSYWHTFRPAQEVYRNELRCCAAPQFP